MEEGHSFEFQTSPFCRWNTYFHTIDQHGVTYVGRSLFFP